MQHIDEKNTANPHVEDQLKRYQAYALAAEKYGRKPTIYNWEKKEKALEKYNALFEQIAME